MNFYFWTMQLSYSFIIPVYNRPEEVSELLRSFTLLEYGGTDFEIIIVEDGSDRKCDEVFMQYKDTLPVFYYYKPNSGPGDSRNFGMKKARGNYFIILDSDVILPPGYLQEVNTFLGKNYADCFGGPDTTAADFSAVQKAINFAMTSFLSTGGIRGKSKTVEKFKPRSFNMGISREVFEKTGGYAAIAVGEDIDLSVRIRKNGFKTALIPDAFVYHKRRSTWLQFYRQVNRFGMGRPILNRWHPETYSPVFLLPTLFCLGLLATVIAALCGYYLWIGFYFVYFLLIFVGSSVIHKNIKIGIYSCFAVLIQFTGYGSGYLKSFYHINILGKAPESAFPYLFYKK